MTGAMRGTILLFLILALLVPAYGNASLSLEKALENHILSVRPWSDVVVRNLSLSAEPPRSSLKKITVLKGLPGPTVFTLEYGNGKLVTARADVDAYEEIVVSSRQLLKNRSVSEDDVFLSRVVVGKAPAGAIRDLKDVVGKVVNRGIGQNRPVLEQHLAGGSLVKRGKVVTIIAESNGVRVSTMGETNENAYVDDTVKVTNLASKKTVTGILVDENTVRISF